VRGAFDAEESATGLTRASATPAWGGRLVWRRDADAIRKLQSQGAKLKLTGENTEHRNTRATTFTVSRHGKTGDSCASIVCQRPDAPLEHAVAVLTPYHAPRHCSHLHLRVNPDNNLPKQLHFFPLFSYLQRHPLTIHDGLAPRTDPVPPRAASRQ